MAAGITSTIAKPRWRAILLIPLALSAFTHLWNPVGFPAIFYDEGIYMRRAMHMAEGLGPQEGTFYDHPYFGQIFLASALSLIGYPGSLQPETDVESIAGLYVVPRILMGLLAILDTFLIFKITEHKYGRRVALIAAILFAVMPLTWLLRRILLDSILLPFLLSSILFATYASSASGRKKTVFVLIAGVLLGTAIFTKVPAFTMIPLVGYLVYSGSAGKRLKTIGLWFIPVIGIPLIWPAYSASINEFDFWLRDVLWQTQRQSVGLWSILENNFSFDPVLLILGIAGVSYAAIKKQLFILLWIIPFIIFSAFVGYLQHFHWIPILPVFCIAAANLIDRATAIRPVLPYAAIAVLGIFGLAYTTLLITTNITSAQFEAAAFVANYTGDDATIAASPIYSWIFIYVFEKDGLQDYRDLLFFDLATETLVLISDNNFQANMPANEPLRQAYYNTTRIATFEGSVREYDRYSYPYANMVPNYEGDAIEIRVGNSLQKTFNVQGR